MLKRKATQVLLEKTSQYPVIAVTGPRQAGKSTLVKQLFNNKPYISLEDLDNRRFATEDPRRFLSQFPDGAILDEAQHCPDLFSYIQTIVDKEFKPGLFILTGSQHFGMTAKITQSLAGRVGFLQLLPFTINELKEGDCLPATLEEILFKGSYPPIYDRKVSPQLWHSDYVLTYIERDVRQLINIQELRNFHRFLQMCAARTGQLLNLSSLAADCGITHNTAKSWISVLEASYIVFLLSPHFNNYNKRLIKSPKLYFYDTGLASLLAGIQNTEQLILHPIRGALFENLVVSELIKNRFNEGLLSNIYFWRDNQGHEVDIIIEKGNQLIPVEIKSGQTISTDYFKGIHYWQKLSQQTEKAWVVYGGDFSQERENISIINWKEIDSIQT